MTPLQPRHNPQASRFEAIVEGRLCVAEYRLANGVMSLTHTLVPAALGGRGIAAALVDAALAHARGAGLRVRPLCSYVVRHMQRHPTSHDLLEKGPGHG